MLADQARARLRHTSGARGQGPSWSWSHGIECLCRLAGKVRGFRGEQRELGAAFLHPVGLAGAGVGQPGARCGKRSQEPDDLLSSLTNAGTAATNASRELPGEIASQTAEAISARAQQGDPALEGFACGEKCADLGVQAAQGTAAGRRP